MLGFCTGKRIAFGKWLSVLQIVRNAQDLWRLIGRSLFSVAGSHVSWTNSPRKTLDAAAMQKARVDYRDRLTYLGGSLMLIAWGIVKKIFWPISSRRDFSCGSSLGPRILGRF